MNEVETMAEQDRRPLPRTQAKMAELISRQQVSYNPNTARWYLGSGDGDLAVKGDGRALREMRAAGLLQVDMAATPDERGAYPVELTEEGQARYRP